MLISRKETTINKDLFEISIIKVFAELAKYDLSEERYEDTFWWRSTFRRKRSPMWNAMRLRDADFAFRVR